ncbi:MAG: short-chain dehydrogenase/reductase [Myxococcaceae bacterium]|nr:short-chain dehydrogenase/reductase [Myxococcaceae bacterium]
MAKTTWLITGAASGIGRELAAQLARRGERLVLWDRDGERLERTVALLGPAVVHSEVVDVVNADGTLYSAERSVDAAGVISRVIHCAGILRVGPSLTMSATDYRATIEVNYLGTVHVARALIPILIEAGKRERHAELVLIASIAGLRGIPSLAGYSASKHAVMGFAQALRDELAEEPVQIRVVCPPAVATPMLMNLPELPAVYRLSPPQPVDKVARAILAGLEKKHWLVLPDFSGKLLEWTQRMVPGLVDRVVRRASKP